MTIRNLERALTPASVTFIGASPQPGSVGQVVMRNLLGGGFKGPVWLVNPRHARIDGTPCFPTVAALPATPDLAVIATPPPTIPTIIDELGRKGCRAAVVITAGLDAATRQAMLDASRPYILRMVGPNSLGLWVPRLGLNASFGHISPAPGRLAFLSQSGALIGGILDWAASRHMGFSYVVSLGDMADVDVGDLLDILAADAATSAILLYLETVPAPRKFMSAARSAARAKPVVVVKSGRHAAGAKAAATHTGALTGADNVVHAAFRRAGLLRVRELSELFTAAETLTSLSPIAGNTLAIVTNGGGAGVLAVDRLMDMDGRLAELPPALVRTLDAVLPANWSRANPIDIIGDADADRYRLALEAVLQDCRADAVLVINCPTAVAAPRDTAQAVIDVVTRHRQQGGTATPVLTNWLGEEGAATARQAFRDSGIPSYESPAAAVRGFNHLWQYTRVQDALMQTPPSDPDMADIDRAAAREALRAAAKADRTMLNEWEAKALLAAYGIPTVDTRIAANPQEVRSLASEILKTNRAVAIKILSPDISHKSDVGGVRLALASADAAEAAAIEMERRIAAALPAARLVGFTVQPMIERPRAHELILGLAEDPIFGPVILFGAGGTAAEVIADTAVALPPLDLKLAHDLMEQTRIFRLLRGYRDRPSADLAALADTLVRLSQIVVERREIRQLDINPLLADEKGVIALDARIVIAPEEVEAEGPNPRLAIRPYPSQWQAVLATRQGTPVLVRPIRPSDEHLYGDFIARLSPEDIRFRFLAPKKEFSHRFIARFTQIDYARAMAFVALDETQTELLGVARLAADPDYVHAEYAIVVRSDLKGQGLGWLLMNHLIRYARAEGLHELRGDVLAANTTMLQMCRDLGFTIAADPDDPTLRRVTLSLSPAEGPRT